jgi:hypothetical protein
MGSEEARNEEEQVGVTANLLFFLAFFVGASGLAPPPT